MRRQEIRCFVDNREKRAKFYEGNQHRSGQDGVKKNISKAVDVFRDAAKDGCAEVQYELGLLYYRGKDNVEKQYKIAYDFLTSAASQCHDGAQNLLGFMNQLVVNAI